jgi:hypothetical protein
MKYTRSYLKKLEELCNALSYKVRYEQGHFQSGYCILESKKVLIINKFFDLEGRINCLLDLIPELPLDLESLTEDEKSFYYKTISIRALQENNS